MRTLALRKDAATTASPPGDWGVVEPCSAPLGLGSTETGDLDPAISWTSLQETHVGTRTWVYTSAWSPRPLYG